jgi:hypothetical protein
MAAAFETTNLVSTEYFVYDLNKTPETLVIRSNSLDGLKICVQLHCYNRENINLNDWPCLIMEKYDDNSTTVNVVKLHKLIGLVGDNEN